jgi:FkbM family methyltransferase
MKLKSLLCHIGLQVTKCSTMERLTQISRDYEQLSSNISFLKYVREDQIKKIIPYIKEGKSQIQQDLFVILMHDFKIDGYFVDFGATDGVFMNNSWLLEKKFAWNGVVAEPARYWEKDLSKNRSCHISTKCVWKTSGQSLMFNEANDAGFSTIDTYSVNDHHFKSREGGTLYNVETISLEDLLKSFDAPKMIDHLSIDTEGSEYEILEEFNFDKWDISIITIEHNYTDKREKVKELLELNGYRRVLTSLSQFDDWYIKGYLQDRFNECFLVEQDGILS